MGTLFNQVESKKTTHSAKMPMCKWEREREREWRRMDSVWESENTEPFQDNYSS